MLLQWHHRQCLALDALRSFETSTYHPPQLSLSKAFSKGFQLHRGKFHAGRPIRKDFMENYFRGCWRSVHDGDRVSRLLVVGKLTDSHFVDSLHKFVTETARVKDLYRSRG